MAENGTSGVRDDGTAEFGQLVLRYLDQAITPEEQELLDTRLRTSEADRRLFLELCEQVCFVNEVVLSLRAPASRTEATKQQPKDRPPLLTFLGDAFQAGGDLLSRPFALSVLFTMALPGLILLVLLVSLSTQTTPKLPAPPQVSRPIASAEPDTVPVAHVTRAHQCVWAEGSEPFSDGSPLTPGGQLRLDKGLVEIAFAQGARVIVQGPAVFDATSAQQGFLRAGSLVAHVTGAARGFAVDTPTAKIVDLGTEFGVCVKNTEDAADIEVFQGEVELTPVGEHHQGVASHRLTAGNAVCVALATDEATATITKIAPRPGQFVRELPPAAPTPSPIVADFSGGNGDTQPDQYPGTAGAGWASGWTCSQAKELRATTSVGQLNPVLDGGEHLEVSAERVSGKNRARQGIARDLVVHGPVDLTKPYVVSFSVRVDSLGRFGGTRRSNQLAFCNMGTPDANAKDSRIRTGWRIQCDGLAHEEDKVEARTWFFAAGDQDGEQREAAWGGQRVPSGIPVVEGNTYSFRILFDPVARKWTPSIGVNGGKSTTFAPLDMRSPGTPEDFGHWSKLYFYWILQNGSEGADVERVGFSVDSIRITQAD